MNALTLEQRNIIQTSLLPMTGYLGARNGQTLSEWMSANGNRLPRKSITENGRMKKHRDLLEAERKEANLYQRYCKYRALPEEARKDPNKQDFMNALTLEQRTIVEGELRSRR